MPTLRQERLAEALLDPKIKTKTEAILASGYAKSTALTQQGRLSAAVGTQHAKRQKEAERRDSARVIYELAGPEVAKRVPDMPDMAVIAALKTSADILASGIGNEDDGKRFIPPALLRERRRRKALRHYRNGMRAVFLALDAGTVEDLRAAALSPGGSPPLESP